MARPKGSKNKALSATIPTGGNHDFNLNSVSADDIAATTQAMLAPKSDVAVSSYTPEDAALDAELNRMSAMNELPPDVEPEPIGSVVAKPKEVRELLGDVVEDYEPASTDQDLREQVYQAKLEGCDSIEATLAIAKRFCRDPLLEKVGYFVFHDIKVYIVGGHEEIKKRDSISIEQKTFGINK
ncbi:MAG: hypothetical protein V4440_12530 [Pseudomonadota bacterium]